MKLLQAGPTARALLYIAGGAALATLLFAAPVRAFSSPDVFSGPPKDGGGGGRWFTGSPADGFDCGACHAPAPGQAIYPFYVAGLPFPTYSLSSAGQPVQHDMTVSWPQFAAAYRALKPAAEASTDPNIDIPAMGLVLEFVAESGQASGTIEIDTLNAQANEFCEMAPTDPNAPPRRPRFAAKLYRIRPGLETKAVRADDAGVLRCEAGQLGQRCLIAMLSCGAEQVSFRWTTPDAWQGPIWFSGAFVASESINQSFDRDSVFALSVPLAQAGESDGEYVRTLNGGCAFPSQPVNGANGGLGVFAAIALGLGLQRRRSRARRAS